MAQVNPPDSSSESSKYSASFAANKLFDGTLTNSSCWLSVAGPSMPIWVQGYWGTAIKMDSYRITPAYALPARTPTAWKIQGSNDGATFTDLDSRSGITLPDDPNDYTRGVTYSLTSTGTYHYYRWLISAYGGDTYLQVNELEFYKAPPPPGPTISVWDGTTEITGCTVSVWDGTTEITGCTLEIAP